VPRWQFRDLDLRSCGSGRPACDLFIVSIDTDFANYIDKLRNKTLHLQDMGAMYIHYLPGLGHRAWNASTGSQGHFETCHAAIYASVAIESDSNRIERQWYAPLVYSCCLAIWELMAGNY